MPIFSNRKHPIFSLAGAAGKKAAFGKAGGAAGFKKAAAGKAAGYGAAGAAKGGKFGRFDF